MGLPEVLQSETARLVEMAKVVRPAERAPGIQFIIETDDVLVARTTFTIALPKAE